MPVKSQIPTFREVKAYLAFGLVPKRLHPFGVNLHTTYRFRKYASRFELSDDGEFLFDYTIGKFRIVDQAKKFHLFQQIHGTTHRSYQQAVHELQRSYCWNGMTDDLKNWIASCKMCQELKRKRARECVRLLADHSYSLSVYQNNKDLFKNHCRTSTSRRSFAEQLKSDSSASNAEHEPLEEDHVAYRTEHDYVADELTKRRKMAKYLKEVDQLQNFDSEAKQVNAFADKSPTLLERPIPSLKKPNWPTLKFDFDEKLSFLPSRDDPQFRFLLGLEVASALSNNVSSGYLSEQNPQCPFVCSICGTDASKLWRKNAEGKTTCSLCFKSSISVESVRKVREQFKSFEVDYNIALEQAENQRKQREKVLLAALKSQKKASSEITSANRPLPHNPLLNQSSRVSQRLPPNVLAFAKANGETSKSNMESNVTRKAIIITESLLKNKGIKLDYKALPRSQIFTQRIRRMKKSKVIRKDDKFEENIKKAIQNALMRKRRLEEYLKDSLILHLRKQKLAAVKQQLMKIHRNVDGLSMRQQKSDFTKQQDRIRAMTLFKQKHSTNLQPARPQPQIMLYRGSSGPSIPQRRGLTTLEQRKKLFHQMQARKIKLQTQSSGKNALKSTGENLKPSFVKPKVTGDFPSVFEEKPVLGKRVIQTVKLKHFSKVKEP